MIEHEVVDVYLANAPDDLSFAANPDEVQATRWVAPSDLNHDIAADPAQFTPWLQIYMAKHITTILGSN